MIITLIVVAILAIGIGLVIYGNKHCYSDAPEVIGVILIFLAVFASFFVIGFLIGAHADADIDYQDKLYEKEMLEYRINNADENIVGNEMLYNDIVEFNNELRRTKKFINSPWLNWFNNAKIASMDYIEIPGLESSRYD